MLHSQWLGQTLPSFSFGVYPNTDTLCSDRKDTISTTINNDGHQAQFEYIGPFLPCIVDTYVHSLVGCDGVANNACQAERTIDISIAHKPFKSHNQSSRNMEADAYQCSFSCRNNHVVPRKHIACECASISEVFHCKRVRRGKSGHLVAHRGHRRRRTADLGCEGGSMRMPLA